jgi:Ca2+-binding RTX toxin-like protein
MATPVKWGDEVAVNTITADNQYQPAITALADGRFVATWADTSGTLADTWGGAIHGQIFAADGSKIGPEFLVNDGSTSDEYAPVITALSDGRFIAGWIRESGGNTSTVARIFNKDGTPFAGDFKIHDGAVLGSVAALANDRFVVTWTSVGAGDIHAQIYLPDQGKFGSQFTVNTQTAGQQSESSAVTVSNDRFVVTWTSVDAGIERIHGQMFTHAGAKVGNEFIVSSQGIAGDSRVSALDNGRFVVSWEHVNGDGTSDIHGQVFNADGTKSGGAFLVNTTTGGDQFAPAIAGLDDGRFVVAWADGDIHAQVFNAEGTKSGAEFLVNTNVAEQTDPSITVIADGRFVVAWTESGNGADLRAQIFDPREIGITVTGTDGNDHFVGTAFNDVMKGGGAADRLYGNGGDDFLMGGEGGDKLYGGAGNDTASYVHSTSAVHVDLGTNFNSGGEAQNDTLVGVENLIGSDFADTLTGNGGDNILEGGAGADVLIGGGGIDTASYRTSTTWVNANLHTGLGSHGDAQGDILSSTIENLIGSDHGDLLTGNAGANVIEGGLGNDGIYGQGGDDTAVFSHNFNDYTLIDYGTKIYVWGPDGYDTVTGIEHLKFADVTITPADLANDGNPLFDSLYYLSRNPDVFQAGIDPLSHFNAVGWQEGRDPNWWFDLSDYLAVNKDVAASGMNPLDHYHQIGWHEGRDPSASFDTTLYLINNPDVAAAGIDPLAHFLQTGLSEGRNSYDAIGQNISGGFDAQYYLFHNPDVAAAGIDPLFHFNAVGWQEGRDSNAWFDTAGYLSHYSDVAAAGINPLQHYEAVGWKEGRDPSAHFDTTGYLAENPDVAAAGINPLDHFLQNGIYEGRQAVNDGMWS